MKRILLLPLVAALLNACVSSQRTPGLEDEGAVLGTRVIVAHSDWSRQEGLREIARILQARGYVIADADHSTGHIRTEYLSLSRPQRLRTRIIAVVSDNQVRLSGKKVTPWVKGDLNDITKRGQSGSAAIMAWRELHEIASTMSDDLSYAR